MPSTLEALQAEILSLSPLDRAKLLDRLISSVDADAEAEAEWDALAEAREQELGSGKTPAASIEVALASLEARFPG
ncbi:MAG: addiction module protein [Gammaproteobacteria bacterium]|jgi:hypothetical protein